MRITNLHRVFRAAVRVALVMLLLLPAACQNRDREENRRLAEEVMAIHDTAMARMTVIHELKLQLEEVAKKNVNGELMQVIDELQEAHKGMMAWMRAYRPPDEAQDVHQARAYLQTEREKIEAVRLAIETAIDRGRTLISKLPPETS